MAKTDYSTLVEKWRKKEDKTLRAESSWLALAGLYWLHEGVNSVGSDMDCDIVLPASAPPNSATLDFDGSRVRLTVKNPWEPSSANS